MYEYKYLYHITHTKYKKYNKKWFNKKINNLFAIQRPQNTKNATKQVSQVAEADSDSASNSFTAEAVREGPWETAMHKKYTTYITYVCIIVCV